MYDIINTYTNERLKMLHCQRCDDLIFEWDLSVVYYIDDEAVCGDCMDKAETEAQIQMDSGR